MDLGFSLPCVELAKWLLGKTLCRKVSGGVLKGMIVETEAYLGPQDRACHTYGGRRTKRCEAMYMKAGTCYVYSIYGMYECFNVSSAEEGAAVLVRALEPLEGADHMRALRAGAGTGAERKTRDIANGPSKLCIAMEITRHEIDKEDLATSSRIWLEHGRKVRETEIAVGTRIGIRNAGTWEKKELRYYINNNEFVSCRDPKPRKTQRAGK